MGFFSSSYSFWILTVSLVFVLSHTWNCAVSGSDVLGLTASNAGSSSEPMVIDYNVPCALYMAESTIPGAGLGLFTAISWNVGESMKNYEVMVPLLELPWHQGKEHETFFDTTDNYVWSAEDWGMYNEVETKQVNSYWPGLGAAVNFNPALVNIEATEMSYDEGGVHRYTSPGAGAFTPYRGAPAIATRSIPAGAELFLSYGDGYFIEREEYDGMPVMKSYENAQTLLHEFYHHFIGKYVFDLQGLYECIQSVASLWDTRLLKALPPTYREARIVMEHDMAALHQPKSLRSLSWLQEHGICIDHIKPGRSTLRDAGNGAFSKRFLPQGTVITASPLHHIFRTLTDMYEFKEYIAEDANGNPTKGIVEKVGHQLQMNYCFGDEASTLLLCPYGPGVNYINHNRSLANLEIRWAAHGTANHNATWLTMEPSDMDWNFNISLAFEYVAIKDIPEGAELFLDYGDSWEHAWLEHVRGWKPSSAWSSYQSAAQWNADWTIGGRDEIEPLRTSEEQEYFPYPSNLSLRCHVNLKEQPDNFDYYLESLEINLWEDSDHADFRWVDNPYILPCNIVDRWEGTFVGNETRWYYDVELTTPVVDEDTIPAHKYRPTRPTYRTGVPRRAITFVDEPYTTDMHLKSAFRHEIGIPKEIFPTPWKDRSGAQL